MQNDATETTLLQYPAIALIAAIESGLIGHAVLVERLLIALLTGGHVLIERGGRGISDQLLEWIVLREGRSRDGQANEIYG